MADAYYIPNGPGNLALMFPGIDMSAVADYYLEVVDDSNAVIASTTLNVIDPCDDDQDQVRIHFLNYLGAIDSITMFLINIDSESKSDSMQKPTVYPLDKSIPSLLRTNIKSNTTYTAATTDYNEDEMDWLNELFDAPIAWLEVPATQSQPSLFIPIVISDQKNNNRKQEDRFVYQVQIDFTLSHEKFIIRN